MRILMVAQWYPPILGGEELHVANLSRELAARGHEVVVATLRQPGLDEEARDGRVRVVRLSGMLQRFGSMFADADRRSAAPAPEPSLTLGLDAVVRRFRPDVIHAHNWLVHAALPIRAARGIPLVQTLHDFSQICAVKVLLQRGQPCSGPGPLKCLSCSASHYGPIKGPITTLSNWTMGLAQRRLVDRFVAVSRAVAIGNRLDGVPHVVIPNFVADEPPDGAGDPRVVSALAGLPREPFLLFVGALARLKGLHVLLEAYRRGPELPPLVVVGYHTRDTEALVRNLPANVTVLGEWPHAAVQAAWPRALGGILPSICQEACPTVVLEAMRAGRPMIATALGGTLDLVADGETGLLVAADDPAALLGAIRRLLAEPRLVDMLGRNAAVNVRAFTAGSVVPRIEAVYREVVAERARPGAA